MRALRMASKYWLSVCLAAMCSFAVAALWSANIGAFYPILEVTIRGKSMQQWVDEEIAKKAQAIGAVEEQIAESRRQIEALAGEPARQAELTSGIQGLQMELVGQQAQHQSYVKLKPWIDRFIPASPFQTITLIVVGLLASTMVKHVFLISNEVLVGRVALDISRSLRDRIFGQALNMDRAAFAARGNATFVTLIVHTTDMLSSGLINALGAALREPLKIVACLVGASLICWRLLLLSVVVAPVVGVLLYFVTRSIKTCVAKNLGTLNMSCGVLSRHWAMFKRCKPIVAKPLSSGVLSPARCKCAATACSSSFYRRSPSRLSSFWELACWELRSSVEPAIAQSRNFHAGTSYLR
ncbi:MAG: ABC transporter transmembrane domain-containing protein [Pirellulaceae bacterium]